MSTSPITPTRVVLDKRVKCTAIGYGYGNVLIRFDRSGETRTVPANRVRPVQQRADKRVDTSGPARIEPWHHHKTLGSFKTNDRQEDFISGQRNYDIPRMRVA